MKNILVTGGAGYIGSITIEKLLKAGYSVVVIDNLTEGHRDAVPKNIPFYTGNIGNKELLRKIFDEHKIDSVLHFAALALVGESVEKPDLYFENNVTQTINLLDTMIKNNILNFIFSSTCAVFGVPEKLPITEDQQKKPINPYGKTKLEIEQVLIKYNEEHSLCSCTLRYFNAAGASEKNGEDKKIETHLIPLALDTALGKRKVLEIYGTDYTTPDGTCIRDYIHVLDIAHAHIKAIKYLQQKQLSFFNLGNNSGFSVREVLEVVRKISGHAIPTIDSPRRPGDPPMLVGSFKLAKKELDWQPDNSELENIIKSTWLWRKDHPKGYKKWPS